MSRLLLTLVLSCAVPVCAWAQQTATPAAADTPAANAAQKKSRNPFGAVIAELTRAAQQQAEASHAKAAAPTADAPAPAQRDTASGAHGVPVALADSNGR